jgi:hypothetical protein
MTCRQSHSQHTPAGAQQGSCLMFETLTDESKGLLQHLGAFCFSIFQ